MSEYELPPILTGTAEQQLRQLRDYLIQLARRLSEEAEARDAAAARDGRSGGKGDRN